MPLLLDQFGHQKFPKGFGELPIAYSLNLSNTVHLAKSLSFQG